MQNLGIAQVTASLIDGGLPYIGKDQKMFGFDISAFNWSVYEKSSYFPPVFVENIADDSGTFAACCLAKRKVFVNNFIKKKDGSSGAQTGEVTWTAIEKGNYSASGTGNQTRSIVLNLIDTTEETYGTYILQQPDEYTQDPQNPYKGPTYVDSALQHTSPTDDCDLLKDYLTLLNNVAKLNICQENAGAAAGTAATGTTATATTATVTQVKQ